MKKTKKKIAGAFFCLLVFCMPLLTSFAVSTANMVTIFGIHSGKGDQTVAAVIDTAVGVAITMGWLCGIQAAVGLVFAG